MTEMSKFMMKNEVTKMKRIKINFNHARAFCIGALSYLAYELAALNMISGQVSKVETSKNV